MAKAVWNNVVLAESERYEVLEGDIYFPPDSVQWEYLRSSDFTTFCPRRGKASYADVTVNGTVNANAAWFYPEPKEAAIRIKDHVAFWKGVSVET